MTVQDTPSEPSESIRVALANELRRRRRVLLTYLLIVSLPIVLAAYAVVRAPTETAAVAARVSPMVIKQIGETIEPRVAVAVQSHAQPIIRQTVRAEVSRAVESAVEPMARTTSALAQDYEQFDVRFAELSTQVQRDAAVVDRVEPRLAEIEAVQGRLGQAEALARDALGSTQALQQQQETLSQRVGTMAHNGDETAAALRALVDRMTAIEKRVATLEAEVKGMRENVRWRIYHRPPAKKP